MKKSKILFVHSQLVQHGSERYLYELCKAIDKERFEVSVLTRFFMVRNNFYYSKLINIGCSIHTRLLSLRHLRYPVKYLYYRYDFVKCVIKTVHSSLIKIIYYNFFNKFDIIAVIGIETYCDSLAPILDKNKNVIIHHVTHQFQFERNYFDECKQSLFVINDEQQRQELNNSNLSLPNLFFLPLPMLFDDCVNIGLNIEFNKSVTRLAVFSRLYKDRPNEPLFRCFSEYRKSNPNTELYFYGDGDPAQYIKLLITLNIANCVFFMGHSKSISESILEDKIDILWLVSMGKSISYSSIEIAACGMPMVFWNLNEIESSKIFEETDGGLNSFNNLEEFVSYNLTIQHNETELKKNGQKIRDYVMQYYDINKNIKKLEQLYLDSSNLKSSND